MTYTNSQLVDYTYLSPFNSGLRKSSIDRITPHCVVGQCTVESLGYWFSLSTTEASSNYGIAKDGKIGMYVEEKNRSWCSSSEENDTRAVTIECASDLSKPYAMNDLVYESLIDLCVDICKRNGKDKLLWLGDKKKTLSYEPASNEMVITVHRWFADTSCPGDWLYSRLGDLAAKVTSKLCKTDKEKNDVLYRVQVGAYSKKENAEAMVKRLKDAGFYSFIKVEDVANKNTITKKSNSEIAAEIYKNICSDPRWDSWGNGKTRIERLELASYDPSAVQKEVNKLF